MEIKKYYKCSKCDLNYVEKKDELCKVCKRLSVKNGYILPYHRIATCHSCHARLDSNFNKACSVCHWLICDCGSCGCG